MLIRFAFWFFAPLFRSGVQFPGVQLTQTLSRQFGRGVCASFGKFILDVDLLQMVSQFLQPVQINDSELVLDTIAEVGPGGTFLWYRAYPGALQVSFLCIVDFRLAKLPVLTGSGCPSGGGKGQYFVSAGLAGI